ncbi:PA14 domain-containing protein [Sediminicola luteus]|uniref:Glycosyl hydrolase n=1 Tax=Sediminicola luteus TaxID=319238 RepID=A0A2A4GCU8_9FLAO|nr:PA14 domain-containing protein [Sediminicola luteus]PCE66283.1 hypothetical protein B7P33_03010 [Sediminicola luteus]
MTKKNLARFGALCMLLLLGWACQDQKQNDTTERPRDVWVFRSVLDLKPRMATAALHNDLWMAYNTQNATLYKAWKGGVEFDGAVYTTKHGPQPTSLGYAYFTYEEGWVLRKDGQTTTPKTIYKGHKIVDGEVIFQSELETPDGKRITLNESPRYVSKGEATGMTRIFNLDNTHGYEVGLKTAITSLGSQNDYATTGTFEENEALTHDYDGGSLAQKNGTLWLAQGTTEITNYFHPGFDQVAANNNVKLGAVEGKKLPLGAEFIEASDCKACHNETLKTVGPAYLEIANKYADDEKTIYKLADKIKNGGSGVWGDAPMTPHPNLEEKKLFEMVKYILSLDDNLDNDETGQSVKYTLGKKSSSMDFTADMTPSAGAGLVANLYARYPDKQDEYSPAPIKNAVVDQVHVLNAKGFGGHDLNIKIILQGKLIMPRDDSYSFRLISDDGSMLYIDGKEVIDNGGFHGFEAVDGEVNLSQGEHDVRIEFFQGGGGAGLSFQWYNKETKAFELVEGDMLAHTEADFTATAPFEPIEAANTKRPGDQIPLEDVHPSFTLHQARPSSFEPKVGGLDFLSEDSMIVSTWDADGSVYRVDNFRSEDPEQIQVTRIAAGLAEPLGVKVVDGRIFVLQKQELTELIDADQDGSIDEYRTVSNDWKVSANFHEFAFGLIYKDGHFYATLATAILPGGASADPQIEDRGKVVKINPDTGSVEFVAFGLRTPNGIGMDVNEEIFVADNQGDWLPSSKIVHIQNGKFYGSRSVDFEGTEGVEEKLPVVWLPQDEIGNSPSEPTYLNLGPYKNQLIHGEVTHGGIKRVFYEEVEGQLQGALFRFVQGVEAGVNRIRWAPDGSLVVGGIGVSGNWLHYGKLHHGLQRLEYNGKTTFEMLSIKAKPNGFDIEFTEPLADNVTVGKDLLEIEMFYYLPTVNYGGPKMDLREMPIQGLTLSDDRKTLSVRIPGLKENHVVYFHLNPEMKSASGQQLWSTEAWYTLNRIPKP